MRIVVFTYCSGSNVVGEYFTGFTVLALGPGFRPIFIHSFNVVGEYL